jgi:hypothetical protein
VKAIKVDDRTPEQRVTHRWGVVAKDKFMSGWGGARGGASRCAWACGPGVDVGRVERWVRARSEMRYVSVVDLNSYRVPSGTAHFHIYVADADHPANAGR